MRAERSTIGQQQPTVADLENLPDFLSQPSESSESVPVARILILFCFVVGQLAQPMTQPHNKGPFS